MLSPFPLEQQLAATWRAARTDPQARRDRVPRRPRRRRLVRRPLA